MSELTQMEYSTATGCTFVILSDEVAVATEESKDPYGRKQSPICQCAVRPQ
jgi:hypothetical protein